MKEVSHILETSHRTDKPNIGNKTSLERWINVLTMKINRIQKRMRGIGRALRNRQDDGILDVKLLDEYQELNESLKNARIMQAEFRYTRNML